MEYTYTYFSKTKQVLYKRVRIDFKPKEFFFLFGEKDRTFDETIHTIIQGDFEVAF